MLRNGASKKSKPRSQPSGGANLHNLPNLMTSNLSHPSQASSTHVHTTPTAVYVVPDPDLESDFQPVFSLSEELLKRRICLHKYIISCIDDKIGGTGPPSPIGEEGQCQSPEETTMRELYREREDESFKLIECLGERERRCRYGRRD
jgi:hypothetical protein